MEMIELMEKTRFLDTFSPQVLKATSNYKVPLICLKPGQDIPSHPSGTGIFYIISGSGIMIVEGKDLEVKAGTMIFVDEGESRGIKATEQLIAFAVHIN